MVSKPVPTKQTDKQKLHALEAELAFQRAEVAAAAEILRIINNASDDAQPVFDAILKHAATLCGTPMASLNIIQDDRKQA